MKRVLSSMSLIVVLTMFAFMAFSSNSKDEKDVKLQPEFTSKTFVSDAERKCFDCISCAPDPNRPGREICVGCVEIPCPAPQQ